jgi:integrase
VLALDEFTNQLLRKQRQWQWVRFAGSGRNPHGYLFTHPDGRPVRPDWLSHRFRALVRKLGLPSVWLHDLRHGAASLAGVAGVELKVIQHDLGLSSAVTTADTFNVTCKGFSMLVLISYYILLSRDAVSAVTFRSHLVAFDKTGSIFL